MFNIKNFAPLTPKEKEIYGLMLEGLNPQEIADKLFLARCTVATHITHIFQKKNVGSTQQLLAQRIRELENTVEQMIAA